MTIFDELQKKNALAAADTWNEIRSFTERWVFIDDPPRPIPIPLTLDKGGVFVLNPKKQVLEGKMKISEVLKDEATIIVLRPDMMDQSTMDAVSRALLH